MSGYSANSQKTFGWFPVGMGDDGRVIVYLLSLLFVGFIIGGIARLLLPGSDAMGCLGTALVGIVGSFVGGLLADLLFGHAGRHAALHPVGLLGSVAGAMVLLLVLRLVRGPR